MSIDETINLRLDNLEEARKEQTLINSSIAATLHRIELALQRSTDKACPLPGHCVTLERDQKVKWEGDAKRFAAVESNYKVLQEHVDGLRQTLHRGMGGLGVLVALGTILGPYIVDILKSLITP